MPAGDFVAVLGPNGVGKSTLLRVVLGLEPLSHGTVRVFGRPPHEARQLVGYLPQRRTFDASLRVRGIDVVASAPTAPDGACRCRGEGRRRVRAAVDDAIEQVGATAYAHRPIGEISGGEQQRLLIAQALVRRPWMLLLDEPLDSLDLPNQAMVAKLVAELCREADITVVLVAHDVNPILPYVDRVVYLGQGGAATGPPDEVITSETLTNLYRTPIEVLRASDGRLVVVGQPEAPAHHHDSATQAMNVVRDLFEFQFMVNAFRAGSVVAVLAGTVGWFMVLRRQTFAGHTLALIGFPGAAGAVLLGLSPQLGFFAFCIGGALVIAALPARRPGRFSEESAVIARRADLRPRVRLPLRLAVPRQSQPHQQPAVRHVPRNHDVGGRSLSSSSRRWRSPCSRS